MEQPSTGHYYLSLGVQPASQTQTYSFDTYTYVVLEIMHVIILASMTIHDDDDDDDNSPNPTIQLTTNYQIISQHYRQTERTLT